MAFVFICTMSSVFPGLGSWEQVRRTPPLVCKGSLASGVLTGDSSLWLQGESASASAVDDSSCSWSESIGDSLSLGGSGI